VVALQAGCSAVKITIRADGAFSKQNAKQAEQPTEDYKTYDDLIDFYLTLPPPPPTIIANPPIITQTPAPGPTPNPPTPPLAPPPAPNPPNFYGPLLSFIRAGPGGGNITQSHLVQLTPHFLTLARLYLGGSTINQVLNSGAAWQLVFAAQSILQPLGLWNQQTLQQWLSYIQARQSRLISLATNLYNNLTAPTPGSSQQAPTNQPGQAGQPTGPGQPTIIQQPPTLIYINPLEIIREMTALWKSKDWLRVAERFPDLMHPLIRHAGFSKPMIVLYGSRKGYIRPSAQIMRTKDDHLEVHNLNQNGYYKNDSASGVGRYFQGLDDISLTYFPIEVRNEKVKTLDLIASDRFALLKKMAGGNTDLLTRSFKHNTSLLSIDADFGGRHLRAVGGLTPYGSMGGLMTELTYESELISGRIGGGALIESSYYGNVDTFLGFLDTEHSIRTPYAIVDSDYDDSLWAWASLTASVSALADRALTHQPDKRGFTGNWGFQGDIRLIPELHAQFDSSYFTLYLYGGVTAAVVPSGDVDLDSPEKSVMLDLVRSHMGCILRILVSNAVNDQESAKQFDHIMFIDFNFAAERSELVRSGRFGADFHIDGFEFGFVGEVDDFLYDGIDDFRVGGRASFMGAYIQGLKSLDLDDFQIQAGFELKI